MSNTKSIKMLLATGLYPPDIGGPATYAKMLEEKLHAHQVIITVVPFGAVRHLPKIVRHISFFWKLFRASRGTDVVYALDPISVGVPAFLVSLLRRKPFIVRLGGDYAWEQGQQRFGIVQTLDEYTFHKQSVPFAVRVLSSIQSFIVRRAQFVIVPSVYLQHIVETWGVAAAKIKVMYSVLSPLSVAETKVQLRAQLQYQGLVITTAARLVPWKGIASLIEVVADLIEVQLPELSLVVIGEGPEKETLMQKAEARGIAHKVRFVGRLGKDALGAAIKASDLFVLNTSYEGLSHQLLEVMELHVPIVTTNVGGNPELITSGTSGILVEVGDMQALKNAIALVLSDVVLQEKLVANAQVRTLDFSEEAVIAKLATFFHTEVVT